MKPFAKIINEELVIGVESKAFDYTIKVIKKGERVNEEKEIEEFKQLVQTTKIK
jgi:hypothetical protein